MICCYFKFHKGKGMGNFEKMLELAAFRVDLHNKRRRIDSKDFLGSEMRNLLTERDNYE